MKPESIIKHCHALLKSIDNMRRDTGKGPSIGNILYSSQNGIARDVMVASGMELPTLEDTIRFVDALISTGSITVDENGFKVTSEGAQTLESYDVIERAGINPDTIIPDYIPPRKRWWR